MPNKFRWQQRLIFTVFVILPVIFWALDKKFLLSLNSFSQFSTPLGQLFGITGFGLFSLNLILSSRLKVLEQIFGPLNKIYFSHHKNGAAVFCLLLLHPIILSVRYLAISAYSGLLFLLPSLNNLPKLFGTIALTLMIIVLSLTFYFKLKYHIWKFSHQFMGLVFIFAFLHILLIPSTISENLYLRSCLIILGVIALLAFSYRFLLSRLFLIQTPTRIAEIKKLNDLVLEIKLSPESKRFGYKPGQFAFFTFIQKGFSNETHPFSFTSAPDEVNISIAPKNVGDFTKNLKNLKPKSRVWIEGPFGMFSYQFFPEVKEMLWIAGGIGITPFLSMAKTIQNYHYKIDLFYSIKNQAEAVYLSELQNLEKKSLNFHIYPYFSEYEGHLTVDTIERMIGLVKDKEIFVCGPKPMMKSIKDQLTSRKINPDQIHSEEFSL